ncbi:MAG: PAS domain-containing sensor histidine kinase [Actinomyces sp.]|nr:MAG: PAS domain-containing sensor histidine kinase [Actinomyces sp.]
MPDGIVVVGADGRIQMANPAADTLFAAEPGGLVGRSIEDLVPPELAERHRRHRAAFEQRPTARPMNAYDKLLARRLDGSTFPAQIALAPVTLRGERCTVATVRDVTAQLATQERLARAVRRTLLAEDRERIARDLHDTVIQELFAIGMGLQAVVGELDETAPARARLDSAIDAIDDVIRTVRTVIFDVHRADDDVPLRTRVVETVAAVAPSLGFEPEIVLVGDIDHRIPPVVAEHLEPVVREALTNVAKHAGATSATVAVEVGDHLEVRVVDDGRGPGGRRPEGRGLLNLAERAAALGGTFHFGPREPSGSEMVWRVPLGDGA